MSRQIAANACSLIALACAIPSAAAADMQPSAPTVVVTAFGKFAGRTINGSETVAKRLDGITIDGARIVVKVLPVRWGAPEATVPDLVKAEHPVLLLGLGEGHPGKITCESTARNAAGYPDELGEPPPSTLDASGPATRAARIAFDPAWFADANIPVVSSDDAGTYLCNNMLYVASAQAVTRVGFVHLPPQGDTADDDYCALCLPVVKGVIAHNLAADVRAGH
jgi:pyroglutamyl-peptidase